MDLTYRAEWERYTAEDYSIMTDGKPTPIPALRLEIGHYTANVFNFRKGCQWAVSWRSGTSIARGTAEDETAAVEAVQSAIENHHYSR